MSNLNLVYDSTLLTQSKVYQIDRTMYQYLYKTGTIIAPQYIFRPLNGQRKKADLKLNHKQLTSKCYEVSGMSSNASVISLESLQLSIF
ncbi:MULTISPECIES: hypothetical protein [unclassified Tolypothrix]|nr:MULTISPECIES: hypothetical protein [unclassified Tolypothrix]BAY96042.1 hypothetical protein NIES3275_81190 [Microchaete diplosiphon NIES-3275]EKE96624.1 hypothetical protein FDUTEX481_06457 [Tolypothrix sp. PCC 7601]MBE9085506.1 hypothetical protein [Tolypothrix sp. LEGE 11397]QIR41953.1 hypothetical protein HCG51_35350 [Tolypothrix sp. PCC 7910]UYD31104.1 hypothetical protein HGR01_40375 [Tolypothrix sp. PCC 7712]